jgi:Tol biopolymer transport system component
MLPFCRNIALGCACCVLLNIVLISGAMVFGSAAPSSHASQVAFTADDPTQPNALILMDTARRLTVRFPSSAVIAALDWMPDGETLLVTCADGTQLSLYEWRDGRLYPREQIGDRRFYFRWSPDFTHVAYAEINDGDSAQNIHLDLYLLDITEQQTRQIVAPGDSYQDTDEIPAVWSPDGTKLAYQVMLPAQGVTDLFVYEVATGVSRFIAGGVRDADWSPDGRTIAYTTRRKTNPGTNALMLYDVDTGSSSELPVPEPYEKQVPSWSPDADSSRMTFMMGDDIYLMNTHNGIWQRISDPGIYAYYPVWSPDGSSLVYFGGSGAMRLYLVALNDGNPPFTSRLLYTAVESTLPAWRPGRR